MELLNGKCKEEFREWFIYNHDLYDSYDNELRLMTDTALNALIIEWFDSIGIHVVIDYGLVFNEWRFYIFNNEMELSNQTAFNSRQEATDKAIIKANEIRNNQLNKK